MPCEYRSGGAAQVMRKYLLGNASITIASRPSPIRPSPAASRGLDPRVTVSTARNGERPPDQVRGKHWWVWDVLGFPRAQKGTSPLCIALLEDNGGARAAARA